MAVPQVPTTAAEPPGPAPTGRSPPYDGLVSVPRQSRRLSGGLPVGQGPFGRLALTHVLAVGGDALVAMALAGSLFFSVDPAGPGGGSSCTWCSPWPPSPWWAR